jgi:hypothetical protein
MWGPVRKTVREPYPPFPQRSKLKDGMTREVTSRILLSVCQLSVTDS